MMNNKNRFIRLVLSLTLAFVLVLIMTPSRAQAASLASGKCGDNLTWTLGDSGTLTISGTGPMDDYDEGCTPWYAYHDSIQQVILGNGVTYVGDRSFQDCFMLSDVSLPDTVTDIGIYAFTSCFSMTDITFPSGIRNIGAYSFMSTYLTSLEIPDHVEFIGDAAFYSCHDLATVNIGTGLTYIGDQVFSNCYQLREISVDPENPAYRSDAGVLYDKTMETIIKVPTTTAGSFSIPAGVTRIAIDAFDQCAALTAVEIPDTVTVIDQYAFWICTGLTEITIPENVFLISYGAFTKCDNLAKITFTGDAPTILDDAFRDVTATVYYPGDNATWTAEVMQNYGGQLTWTPMGTPGLTIPAKPYKIANVVSGAHVYWKAIPGIEKYGLWRSETGRDGEYKWIGNPTVPHFTDTKVQSGKTYYYKVTTVNTKTGQHSGMSEPIGIIYVSTPDITSRFNKAAGITLGWNQIDGATGYAIYRKSYSGSDEWVRVATISGNSTFTWQDTSVKNSNGTIYRYTIRALAGNDMKTLSGCRNTGRTMARLTSRSLNSAVKTSPTSIKCQWTTSSAVTGYEVRFMVGNEVYQTFTVGNFKTGVKTFTGLPSGQSYKIQVRSYLKVDGMGFYSAWSEPINVTLP